MDGLVLVDKPAGKTSHDLTLATRRALGVRKAGHAGTLDPFATGLLLVLVGRARRAQRFLMAPLGIAPTIDIAEALYVGLVTDTGKFMYENTGPRAHVMAAELIATGIDVHQIYRRLYEGMPYPKLELLGRALAHMEHLDEGAVTFSYLSRDDFRMAGAEESYSEGIIDHLRSVEGTKVAALARELMDGDGSRKKVSLRSTDGEVDVSAIARAGGGGGHRQAAGFSTELTDTELVAFLREQVAAQL